MNEPANTSGTAADTAESHIARPTEPIAANTIPATEVAIHLLRPFAAVANSGVYNKPTLYTKILDHDGNVLLENNPESRTVIKETTAALMTSAMRTVVTSGTGTRAALSNMPVAGKTGTTDHDKDLWFCGYTPYYTCAVWGGYDENKSFYGG